MSAMDWESDPELLRIRNEFIESFVARRSAFTAFAAGLERGDDVIADFRIAAHRLAGAAESYGFPTLTAIGELVDELLTAIIDGKAGPAAPGASGLASLAGLMAETIASAYASRNDPSAFGSDARVAKLRTWVLKACSRSRNGSS